MLNTEVYINFIKWIKNIISATLYYLVLQFYVFFYFNCGVATLLSLSKSVSTRGTLCAQIRFMCKCSWRIFHTVPKAIPIPSTTTLIVQRRSSSMNVFTDATYVGVITDGLPERASFIFDLPSLKRLNRWKTVAFFISLVCWALCIVLYVSVAEYPKLKQNFTAARDSLFSGNTIMDVVCEQCASLKCTLNALYTSHDVRINVKKNIWRHVNSRQYFAEFRKKTSSARLYLHFFKIWRATG